MLRLQGRAILALVALSFVVQAESATAVPLPETVNLQLNPNPLRPGDELTISGNPIFDPRCVSGELRLALLTDPTVEYAFGDAFPANAAFLRKATQLTTPTGPVDFTKGTYVASVLCTDAAGIKTLFTTPRTLIVNPATSPAPTTTIASSTSSSMATTSSSSGSSTSSSSSTAPSSTSSTLVPATDGTVAPSTAKPTKTVLVLKGGGFAADIELQIALSGTPGTLATAKSTPQGFYSTFLVLPATAPPGERQVTVTGNDPTGKPRTTSATVTIEDLNCNELSADDAQLALGPDKSDPHGLDADQDGRACQSDSELAGLGAGSEGGGGGSTGAGAQAGSAGGSLPRTGTGRAPRAAIAGMTGVVLGALLLGLSQPVQPAGASHLRPRVSGRRGRRRGNHFADGTSDLSGGFGPAGVLRRIRRAS